MNVSIITVNWNTKELLKKCLCSLNHYKNNSHLKVIIVDNNSIDGSREMVSQLYPHVKLINSGDNIGFGRANNLALPYCDGDYIYYLNPDTEVKKGTIEEMVKFLDENPDVGALSCKIRFPGMNDGQSKIDGRVHELGLQWFPTPLIEFLRVAFLSRKVIKLFKKILPYHDPEISGYMKKLYGTTLMVRKCIIDEIGGFDERFFMYAEDVDLSRRIIENEWKLYYLSSVEILHVYAGSSDGPVNKFSILMKCESVNKLIIKYSGKVNGILYRIAISSAALIKIAFIGLLLIPLSILKPRMFSNYLKRLPNYTLMIKWSLNLEKPKIQTKPSKN